MHNPFVLPDTCYKRDFNIVDGYYQDNAKYLSLMTGDPVEKCLSFVKEKVKPNQPGGFIDPPSLVLTRNEYGDRKPENITFMQFLNRVIKNKLLISPSMAVYLPESVKQSTHALFIEQGVNERKTLKGEMFKAERSMNNRELTEKEREDAKELYMDRKGGQENKKINNNSYSGATVSIATILYYKSTHSSLTSTCRTATSYANAANEKYLSGNRHYFNPEVTKANVISIINNCDLDAIEEVCQTFSLHYPTPEETLYVIRYSSDLYWRSPQHWDILAKLCEAMTPVERAAFVYINDLHHLHEFNPDMVVNFLKELSTPATADDALVSEETWQSLDDDTQMLASFLCYVEVASRDLDEIYRLDPPVWEKIKATGVRATQVMQRYEKLIRSFWLTVNLPSSIHALPTIYRRAAIVSDTDSTMFTLQKWVERVIGRICFTPEACRVTFSMVFLVSQMVLHVLAQQSAQMGVSAKKLRLLAMKNEFFFAVLTMTTRSKHYFASQDAQEGAIFEMAKQEIKGVGLRDSKVPPKINKAAKGLMLEITTKIKNEEKIHVYDILKDIGDTEREIRRSIESGSFEYLTSGQIKAEDSYKKGVDSAAYKQYLMWDEVFAPSLGSVGKPPYATIKISLAAEKKTQLRAWCASMDDQGLAQRLQQWLDKNKASKGLTTLLIPYEVAETNGIPADIVKGADIRKIISNTMGAYYLILESLNIFIQDKNITRLVSDYY